MISVEIQNFQSIESATIELDGFVALVGRSNIGKSSVVRAVHAAITNASGTSFVRHGPECARRLRGVKTCKCFSQVRIKGSDFDLLWEKGDAVGRYELNGKTYDAIARGFPEFLAPDWTPVKVGTEALSLQVAPQWQPLFLLDESGGVVADVLSDVAQLDQINAAMRLVETDRRDAMSTLRVREKDKAVLQLQLRGFQGLDDALGESAQVEPAIKRAELAETRLTIISGYHGRAQAFVADIVRLKPVLTLDVPDTADLEQQSKDHQAMILLLQRMLDASVVVDRLQGVEDIEDVGTDTLEDLNAASRDLARLCADYQDVSAGLEAMDGVEDVSVPDTSSLAGLSKKVMELHGYRDRLRALRDPYQALLGVSEVEEVATEPLAALQTAFRNVLGLRTRLEDCEASAGVLERELTGLAEEEQAVQEALGTLGVCPVCQQPTSTHGDHL